MSLSKLQSPMKVGRCQLAHRMVMAPLTRFRCNRDFEPTSLVKEYYSQRASTPGTLLITEAVAISQKAVGEFNTPGIWTDRQITAWREVTDAVHAKGSFMFLQLWALGRAAQSSVLQKYGLELVSSTATPMEEGKPTPRALEEAEILEYIDDYVQAARNAMAAGFDGVEIHAANGYLIDQFIQDTCNKRTDRWGGSIENRSRFPLEVAKAVSAAVGSDRTAIRMSPYSSFQGMYMRNAKDQFSYLVEQLKPLRLAYLHIVQPRIAAKGHMEDQLAGPSDAPYIPQIWGNTAPLFMAGGFTPSLAEATLGEDLYKDKDVAIVFGRYFISNPDLPFRGAQNVGLTAYDRTSFYTPEAAKGYTDYPFSSQFVESVRS